MSLFDWNTAPVIQFSVARQNAERSSDKSHFEVRFAGFSNEGYAEEHAHGELDCHGRLARVPWLDLVDLESALWELACGSWLVGVGLVGVGLWELGLWELGLWELARGSWHMGVGTWELACSSGIVGIDMWDSARGAVRGSRPGVEEISDTSA
ncbi:hypothetical protein N7466_001638 [Penicillium verhagenii]|uniref:uncharacterized protein n=1 Tax=Penicillium verhagenii TaxID=1562060 RepID=UPI0025458B76|nr:uncharacterized protein N7466_001638 [Penicillium verhagenii]KAJ5938504.1 hypothetical protein N7466_001638 [Penicillium verhagenii]